MNDIGYLYIPNVCWSEYCSLHVHLHGCGKSAAVWMDTYNRGTGLLEYAATNNMVLLFPSNDDDGPSTMQFPSKYCWSSWDTDDKFNPQLTAIHNMISAIVMMDDKFAT